MEIDTTFITNAITIAVETIALIEAIKVFFKKKSLNIPTFIYTLFSLVLSFGLALIQCNSFVWGEIKDKLPIGLLAFSVSQLGYDYFLQVIQKKLKADKENV